MYLLHKISNKFTINGRDGYLEFVSNRVVRNLDDVGARGIDAIYRFSNHPPHFIIDEVKFQSNINKTPSLPITKTKGRQMDKKWIELSLSNSLDKKTLAQIDNLKYQSIVTKVDAKGNIIIHKVDSAGKVGDIIYKNEL